MNRPVSLRAMRKQSGMVLFIALVLLLVLTIAGVSVVQTTSLEERMARNTRDRMMAFQAAEAALRDAEMCISTLTNVTVVDEDGDDGLWDTIDFGDPEPWLAVDWNEANKSRTATQPAGVAAAPRYIVEHIATVVREDDQFEISDDYGFGAATHIQIFRVTSRGIGGSPNARVMLQSTFGRILD